MCLLIGIMDWVFLQKNRYIVIFVYNILFFCRRESSLAIVSYQVIKPSAALTCYLDGIICVEVMWHFMPSQRLNYLINRWCKYEIWVCTSSPPVFEDELVQKFNVPIEEEVENENDNVLPPFWKMKLWYSQNC